MEKEYLPEQINRVYPLYKDWNEILKEQNGVMPVFPQTHPEIEDYKRIAKQLGIFFCRADTPYIQWKQQKAEKLGLDFLMKRLNVEYKYLQEVQKENSGFPKEAKGSVIRIADTAISAMCVLKKGTENLPDETIYCNIATNMKDEYKPYTDKEKLSNRQNELKKAIDSAVTAYHEQSEALFLCLKNVADTAIRLEVYIDTDYKQEQERLQNLNGEKPTKNELTPESEQGFEPESGMAMMG